MQKMESFHLFEKFYYYLRAFFKKPIEDYGANISLFY